MATACARCRIASAGCWGAGIKLVPAWYRWPSGDRNIEEGSRQRAHATRLLCIDVHATCVKRTGARTLDSRGQCHGTALHLVRRFVSVQCTRKSHQSNTHKRRVGRQRGRLAYVQSAWLQRSFAFLCARTQAALPPRAVATMSCVSYHSCLSCTGGIPVAENREVASTSALTLVPRSPTPSALGLH